MTATFDPRNVPLPKGHWINGRYLTGVPLIELLRPSDAFAYAASPVADDEVVDLAVTSAAAALQRSGWTTCRPTERANILKRWASLIETNAQRLGQLESIASTRPIAESVSIDAAVTAEQIRFFAEFADKEGGDVVPTDSDHLGMILSEPYGVVGAITPWNVPLSMAGWKIGPALAAGNAIVLKPSEHTPFSTLFLAELGTEAGIPAGIINIVLGDGLTTGAHLVAHPGIAKISFTGSTVAGGAILRNIAGAQIKPVTLELGGKSPQVVFASADIEVAAHCVARGILLNAGQTCVAGSRVIVAKTAEDAFMAALKREMSKHQPGLTWDSATNYSPIISERQINRIHGIVEAAVAHGAECVLGGKRLDRTGYFFEPTILAGVAADSPALTEEIFGPVVTVQTFSDENEAYALSRHSTYGLAAGVYTQDLSQAMRAVKQIEAGTVWVNRYGRSRDHILPTGGYKASGIGKDLGKEAFRSNRRQKSVLIKI
ncbi:aldehyde dehydrogenase family protein [Ensifer adhaerens]|uniref:aldehyde dehydrogenase family protein n=1 Tax=Ensifer adhaerens TaxID=106592 RepID=UPI001CBFF2E9|nr:aldehyde dehydrogenase family protein [Ensifer adhaerens]MBZ7924872.1 aldehyde dehydrogenase family protein [Ensifer adhaerens]UAX95913.1 aldehyde dehydrogenase family protein [Ensifer adhaerens]UAY04745.1 aldehyde dehydrogenase family protein [Ensifer adhaerens]UAY10176.1 aldehyde dehydrogenase family protein [Ensifer adhaerens]